jgi:glutamine synthetase
MLRVLDDHMTTATELAERCEAEGIDLVRLLFVTPNGEVRTQSVDISHIAALEKGVPISKLVHSYNALGYRQKDGRFDASGEVRLQPDGETFRKLPYANRCGGLLCDVTTIDGDRWPVDARSTLRSLVESLVSNGLQPTVAFESEFHLFEREGSGELVPTDEQGAYSTESTRNTHEFVMAVRDALDSQGIDVRKYYPEWGAGKHEIVIDHGSALPSADEYVLFKETVKSVAANRDLQATFLPKPARLSTNGCHIHLSLWDGDENRFADSERDSSISETAESFIAGVLEHAPGLTALTAGTANSYQRLRPQVGAAAFICWGYGNREALVRIPGHAGDTGATRIEFRAADNTANPYIALTGLLAAGYDGIKRELRPPKPVDIDPGNAVNEYIERLPTTLGEALNEFESDTVLRDALGKELAETYLEVKRSHWNAFTESAAEWELDRLRNIF